MAEAVVSKATSWWFESTPEYSSSSGGMADT